MTYADCLELRKEYLHLIGKKITDDDEKEYIIKDVLIVPPFEELSGSRYIYFKDYNKTKNFSSAISQFIPRPDLEVKLYALNTEAKQHRILELRD
jgi:hypothetical protein